MASPSSTGFAFFKKANLKLAKHPANFKFVG
jgi:hypothetical protein